MNEGLRSRATENSNPHRRGCGSFNDDLGPSTVRVKVLTMTFETSDSVTLKIWDRSAIDRTIDKVVQDLSARAKAAKCGVAVTRSGPNTFTVSLSHNAPQGATFEEITR
ncbi:hypothetical protein QFZ40_000353 [Arthrobacter pascens]|nr:hypothetical protein [Arthrobacter pascens]